MKLGSLFSGYGGLDMGISQVIDARPVWFSEIEKAPSQILAHHWADVPNLGDITKVDWADVEPVDILTGGFPCQDVSHAGRRAGLIRDGEGRTRSGLWGEMLRAITELKPALVIAENVRGLLSAKADSDMEPCTWCMGDNGAAHMRALGAVLADLADAGYDTAWTGLRAADIGAPHNRFRVFIAAWPRNAAHTNRDLFRQHPRAASVEKTRAHKDHRSANSHRGPGDHVAVLPTPRATRGGSATETVALLPTPVSSDGNGPGAHGDGGADLRTTVTLLPTPAVNDMGRAYTPDEWDAWTERMKAAHNNGNGHGKSLEIEAQRLLPTPSVADVEGGRKTRSGDRSNELLLNGIAAEQRFGDYAPAVALWEHVINRPAPPPTEPTGRDGGQRLSPAFVEWMMGLPKGHVADVPGLSRVAQLKALGNGVVPQQAAAALVDLLTIRQEVAA